MYLMQRWESKKLLILGSIVLLALLVWIALGYTFYSNRHSALIDALQSATVTIPGTVETVTLEQGTASYTDSWSRSTVRLGKFLGVETLSDGSRDAFVEIILDSEGSGTYSYVAIFRIMDELHEHTDSVFIGDRIELKSAEVMNRGGMDYDLAISYLDRKPDEPMSAAPAVPTRRVFRVHNHVMHSPALELDGLGEVSYGLRPEEVLERLIPLFGAPTKDTGTISSFSAYGTCPGENIRVLEWGGLHLLFGDTEFGDNAFFGYEYVSRDDGETPQLATREGVTIGSRRSDILALYPGAEFSPMDLVEDAEHVLLTSYNKSAPHYSLSGTLENEAVTYLAGGIACGE